MPPPACAHDRFFEGHHVRFLPEEQKKPRPQRTPGSLNTWKALGILKKTLGICLPKNAYSRHCLYPLRAISNKNHQKNLVYFSHLAPLILLFLLKGRVKSGGGGEHGPMFSALNTLLRLKRALAKLCEQNASYLEKHSKLWAKNIKQNLPENCFKSLKWPLQYVNFQKISGDVCPRTP